MDLCPLGSYDMKNRYSYKQAKVPLDSLSLRFSVNYAYKENIC